jgi:nitroimidazol reductase NimA-like FMN-containing flavoprotein (pyridoxamine 5'-phosphate oxidase superfamily)
MQKQTEQINQILDSVTYGTLALSDDDQPYSVPVNFARIGEDIYFHGAHKSRKMEMLRHNPKVSLSVVQEYSVIASYMSSTDELACPANQFFASVSIDGEASIVETREEKAVALEALMQKLQNEGGYKPMSDEVYTKAIRATAIVKISPSSTTAKYKFGQHLSDERFEMIIKHLEERGESMDIATVEMMQAKRGARDGI